MGWRLSGLPATLERRNAASPRSGCSGWRQAAIGTPRLARACVGEVWDLPGGARRSLVRGHTLGRLLVPVLRHLLGLSKRAVGCEGWSVAPGRRVSSWQTRWWAYMHAHASTCVQCRSATAPPRDTSAGMRGASNRSIHQAARCRGQPTIFSALYRLAAPSESLPLPPLADGLMERSRRRFLDLSLSLLFFFSLRLSLSRPMAPAPMRRPAARGSRYDHVRDRSNRGGRH